MSLFINSFLGKKHRSIISFFVNQLCLVYRKIKKKILKITSSFVWLQIWQMLHVVPLVLVLVVGHVGEVRLLASLELDVAQSGKIWI
jgi:hypothetical protein